MKTLYKVELDESLRELLKDKYPAPFDNPNDMPKMDPVAKNSF